MENENEIDRETKNDYNFFHFLLFFFLLFFKQIKENIFVVIAQTILVT